MPSEPQSPRPPTRLHPGNAGEWHENFALDPMHDPAWEDYDGPGGWRATDDLDDDPAWDTDRRCVGRHDFVGGERLLCPRDATGPDALCDECREREWDFLCTRCKLNISSYVTREPGRPPVHTCRACYQWLRRNRSKYPTEAELLEQLANVVARRRRRAGRSATPER